MDTERRGITEPFRRVACSRALVGDGRGASRKRRGLLPRVLRAGIRQRESIAVLAVTSACCLFSMCQDGVISTIHDNKSFMALSDLTMTAVGHWRGAKSRCHWCCGLFVV